MSKVLYGYWRSSAAYRVRIALNLKGVPYKTQHVSLIDGAQRSTEFLGINAQGLVPVWEDDGVCISQSLAILEFLEEAYPEVSLLPDSLKDRALARQIALTIACDIHPLCNLRVLGYLKNKLSVNEESKLQWYRHWVSEGLSALEQLVKGTAGEYCLGDKPTIADCCLVPQLYNAERFDISGDNWPTLRKIAEECRKHSAFIAAHPNNNQSD